MEPKYLAFRRWLDIPIIIWEYEWIPRHLLKRSGFELKEFWDVLGTLISDKWRTMIHSGGGGWGEKVYDVTSVTTKQSSKHRRFTRLPFKKWCPLLHVSWWDQSMYTSKHLVLTKKTNNSHDNGKTNKKRWIKIHLLLKIHLLEGS